MKGLKQGLTKKGMFSVKTLVTAVAASSLLVFSAAALSAQAKPALAKPVPAKSAPAVSSEQQQSAHAQTATAATAINLNKADLQTLAQLNGVGDKKAQAIIAYRESNGGFKSVDDLLNVKGIGEKILEKNRALLSVN